MSTFKARVVIIESTVSLPGGQMVEPERVISDRRRTIYEDRIRFKDRDEVTGMHPVTRDGDHYYCRIRYKQIKATPFDQIVNAAMKGIQQCPR